MLTKIQQELKAPKNQLNKFGNYKYRSCEDILEALKPLLGGATLTLTDEVQELGGVLFIKATATLLCEGEEHKVTSCAGIDIHKKGMDLSQSFGAASSYARKYALNGLFLIDDTKDSDATNNHEVPNATDKNFLNQLVYKSNLSEEQKAAALESIKDCQNYSMYERIRAKLEDCQPSIHEIPNPSQKDISNHLKKLK